MKRWLGASLSPRPRVEPRTRVRPHPRVPHQRLGREGGKGFFLALLAPPAAQPNVLPENLHGDAAVQKEEEATLL